MNRALCLCLLMEDKGMVNALRQFDHYSPTWKWQTSASDHFPVTAILKKAR